jgi:hypothetical protein
LFLNRNQQISIPSEHFQFQVSRFALCCLVQLKFKCEFACIFHPINMGECYFTDRFSISLLWLLIGNTIQISDPVSFGVKIHTLVTTDLLRVCGAGFVMQNVNEQLVNRQRYNGRRISTSYNMRLFNKIRITNWLTPWNRLFLETLSVLHLSQ